MRSLIHYVLPFALAACGDNDDNKKRPDASVEDMMPEDAAIDAPLGVTCAYTETADATNDDLFGSGTAEMTGIMFGAVATQICGTINNGHFNAGEGNVDVDSFRFTVPSDGHGLVYLTAPGAEALDEVLVEIYSMTTGTSSTAAFQTDLAATATELPAGDYLVTVSAYETADLPAGLQYKVTLLPDLPTRCAKSTAAAAYTETLDTAAASENDVYEIRYGNPIDRRFTANPLDMVEPTGITVTGGSTHRVTGVSTLPTVAPVSWMDSFQDRDTYQITMGANTNVLSIRLNWPGTTGDFDFFLFPMAGVIDQAQGWDAGNMEDEFVTTAVIPGMSYWVFVGLDDASTGQPITYDLTFCGDTFSP